MKETESKKPRISAWAWKNDEQLKENKKTAWRKAGGKNNLLKTHESLKKLKAQRHPLERQSSYSSDIILNYEIQKEFFTIRKLRSRIIKLKINAITHT